MHLYKIINWNKPIAKTIILAFSVLTLLPAQDGPLVAGEGEKKVITSGYGKNPDEALTQALRNAVEEAVGTYMTSTTRMENSEIIEDKILSLSRGFIKDFKKLSEMKVEGETKVTVSAIVTQTQILETLKASGVKVKVAGKKMFQQFASFDRQMEDEYKLIFNVLKDLPKEGPLDYEVEVLGQPVRSGNDYEVKVRITGTINHNFRNQFTNFRNILNETAFDKKNIDSPFIFGKNGLIFNIANIRDNILWLTPEDVNNYSVIYSKDEINNYKNLYGSDMDGMTWCGGPTYLSSIKENNYDSWNSIDFFKQPYSPYIIGLWTNWSDISDNGYKGKIELFKYLNKKTHQFITMYMEDYFYDIGFRLVIASNKEYVLKIKVKGDGESRRDRKYKSDFRHMTLVGDTDTFLVGIKEILSRQGYGSEDRRIPIIHEQQFTLDTYGMDLESLKFDKLIRSRFWDEGKTYSAGFPSNLRDKKPRFINPGPPREGCANMVYKLALLPGEQPYFINYTSKMGLGLKNKYQFNKSQNANPLFETTMTLVLSSNVLENLESIEIEPLPVEVDFIPSESDIKEEKNARLIKEAKEMQKAKRLEDNHGVTKAHWFMMSDKEKREHIKKYGKPVF